MALPASPSRCFRRRLPRAAACALALALALPLALALLAGCGRASPGRALSLGRTAALPASRASHVVVVVMENAEYGEVIGGAQAPYVNSLARRYGLATQSFAIRHPSLPNYLALTSGSTQGINSDCTGCAVSARNVVDQLEAARISWRAYLEDVPGPCFGGASAGGYAKKHNPFAYYRDVARSPARCERLVGFARLAADLRAGSLPTFAWISPNLCDDGHDCGVAGGERFLARTIPALLRELGPHGMLVLSWDEGVSDAGCCGVAAGGRVATIVAGPDVRPGARTATPIDHYGVLGSIEEALGLPALAGARDPRSGRLWSLFARRPRIR
jgi:phosphatidylinositol-3-phosphatase